MVCLISFDPQVLKYVQDMDSDEDDDDMHDDDVDEEGLDDEDDMDRVDLPTVQVRTLCLLLIKSLCTSSMGARG